MHLKKIIFLLGVLIFINGCAITRNVSSAANKIQEGDIICIEVNPRVTEPDILNVIEQSIFNNGFIAEGHKIIPDTCQLNLTYVAHRKWDFSPFLSQANINLYKGKKLIGSIEYKTPNGIFGGGGANPAKWDSTEEKLAPLMAKLLKI